MNKVHDIRIGLEIFEGRGGTLCDVDHDVFMCGQSESEFLSEEEVTVLRAAGWRVKCECPDCSPDCQACTEWSIFV